MDFLYNGRVNKRIISGNFPHCKVDKDSHSISLKLNIQEKAKPGLLLLKENDILSRTLLPIFAQRFSTMESLHNPGVFIKEVNLMINTGLNPQIVNTQSPIYQQAIQLCPFVTLLDKVLWYAVCAYGLEITNGDTENKKEMLDLFFAWLYILVSVQQKEVRHKKTLDLGTICNASSVFDILLGEWNECDTLYYTELSSSEKSGLRELANKRTVLEQSLLKEAHAAKMLAEQTESDWTLFLDILNDLAQREAIAIDCIRNSRSRQEKINALDEYGAMLQHIETGHYLLNGKNISLLHVLECVMVRLQQAPAHCMVIDENGHSFRLHPLAPILVMNPETYNYLFLVYHHFRLNQTRENALAFSEVALACLKRNLNSTNNTQLHSLTDIASVFCELIQSFVSDNQIAINQLSYNELQPDSVILGEASLASIATESYDRHLSNMLVTAKQQANNADYTLLSRRNDNHLEAELQKEKDIMRQIESETIARQIVVSLNIIYLFNDALRIMGNNGFISTKTSKTLRKALRKIDDHLIRAVYTENVDVFENREQQGVRAESLSDFEYREEECRSLTFITTLKEVINKEIENIESRSIETILTAKQRIREEIFQCPPCDLKDQLSEWIDSISDRICNALIERSKSEVADFEAIRLEILTKLGAESGLLPESALDSLTTAEHLYKKYATSHYAEKGFDYSCISALYYQAFEVAYNQLIWCKYVAELNVPKIEGHSFTDILIQSKRNNSGIAIPDGYLPKEIGPYIDKKYPKSGSILVWSCMYGPFAVLMKQIKETSRTMHFCDFFAKRAGFRSSDDMLRNKDYLGRVQTFAQSIWDAKENRNNASHGGNGIDKDQCQKDKRTVLYDLETLRENSIGLIQQLLILLKDGKQLSP